MLPPVALHVEIDTADGLSQHRWDGNARNPANRPQNITCGSTLMNGYANGGASLARNINQAFPDLGLYDTIRFVGVDGQIAYEGRGSRFPREASTQHRINAEAVGWMAHARDTPIMFLGVDRDLSQWGPIATRRRTDLLAAGFGQIADPSVSPDSWKQSVRTGWTGPWELGQRPLAEAWYDAGPVPGGIARITGEWSRADSVNGADTNWNWHADLTSDDRETGGTETTGNLRAVGPDTFSLTSPGRRYAMLHLNYADSTAGTDGVEYFLDWTDLTVYGAHGLPLIGAAPPYGLLGSDIIRYTAALGAPLLDTSGVLDTSHPIAQFAFRDLTDPYDMWLLANPYERWNLAVWDNRVLHYGPLPDPTVLQTADWILRSDHDNGLTRSYDGPTTDGAKNGVIVRFQNVSTGRADMIDPTTSPELAATDTRLAANRAGIQAWEGIQLPNPNSPAGAAKIGAAALAEFNRQRTPGRFTITGHIWDAQGNPHQGWIVKAGQTVLLEEEDDGGDPIRVVHEAGWSQDSRQLTISADAASKTIDAIVADMGL